MALMDRDYVREAPSWHLGEARPSAVRGSRYDYERALCMSRNGSRRQRGAAQGSRSIALLALLGLLGLFMVVVAALLVLSGVVTIAYVPGA